MNQERSESWGQKKKGELGKGSCAQRHRLRGCLRCKVTSTSGSLPPSNYGAKVCLHCKTTLPKGVALVVLNRFIVVAHRVLPGPLVENHSGPPTDPYALSSLHRVGPEADPAGWQGSPRPGGVARQCCPSGTRPHHAEQPQTPLRGAGRP